VVVQTKQLQAESTHHMPHRIWSSNKISKNGKAKSNKETKSKSNLGKLLSHYYYMMADRICPSKSINDGQNGTRYHPATSEP
jgi:hypothetical protein